MINQKTGLLVIFVVFIISVISSYGYFSFPGGGKIISPLGSYQTPKNNGNGSKINPNEPRTEACPLTGEYLTKTEKSKWEKRRPLGVMIENHKQARPQSGLSSADVVYEAVAEGGITRFLAIFYCKDAPYIGPIRSARIYFIKLLQGYGDYPLYAHVGGANTPGPADALGEIRDLGWGSYNDLNQFSVPFPYFWRDYERLPNRATEHTVYSSTGKLWQYAASNRKLTNIDSDGKAWDKNFTYWKFQKDADKSQRGTIEKISFGFWDSFAADYSVIWNYDRESNSYKRENGGEKHLDKNNNQQITAKNVIIIFSKESPANDGYPGGHLLYKITGSGQGLIFQNGEMIKISWQKEKEESSMIFYNEATGKEIELVRGMSWVEFLPLGNKVTY